MRSAEARSFSRARFWICRDALLADAEQMADLAQAVRAVAGQAETQIEHLAFARPQVLHEEVQGFLTFGVVPQRGAFVVRHRFGELEIAVVVEDGVERDRSSRGRLQVGQVFEAAAGARGQFLRAGQDACRRGPRPRTPAGADPAPANGAATG